MVIDAKMARRARESWERIACAGKVAERRERIPSRERGNEGTLDPNGVAFNSLGQRPGKSRCITNQKPQRGETKARDRSHNARRIAAHCATPLGSTTDCARYGFPVLRTGLVNLAPSVQPKGCRASGNSRGNERTLPRWPTTRGKVRKKPLAKIRPPTFPRRQSRAGKFDRKHGAAALWHPSKAANMMASQDERRLSGGGPRTGSFELASRP